MQPSPPTEEELIARWQGGDEAALEALLAPHLPVLRRHLAARFGPDIAEEATSEVCYKLARGASYEHRGAFRAWLQTVGRRAAVDITRRNKRIKTLARSAELEMEPSVTHGAERRVREARRGQRLDRHIADLPTLHRVAVRMRYWKGSSTEEIAEALQLSAGQVRDRLAYALKAMRDRMKDRTLD